MFSLSIDFKGNIRPVATSNARLFELRARQLQWEQAQSAH
jgi:hypothetical protein